MANWWEKNVTKPLGNLLEDTTGIGTWLNLNTNWHRINNLYGDRYSNISEIENISPEDIKGNYALAKAIIANDRHRNAIDETEVIPMFKHLPNESKAARYAKRFGNVLYDFTNRFTGLDYYMSGKAHGNIAARNKLQENMRRNPELLKLLNLNSPEEAYTQREKIYDMLAPYGTLATAPFFVGSPIALGRSMIGSKQIAKKPMSRFGKISRGAGITLNTAFPAVAMASPDAYEVQQQNAAVATHPTTGSQVNSHTQDSENQQSIDNNPWNKFDFNNPMLGYAPGVLGGGLLGYFLGKSWLGSVLGATLGGLGTWAYRNPQQFARLFSRK